MPNNSLSPTGLSLDFNADNPRFSSAVGNYMKTIDERIEIYDATATQTWWFKLNIYQFYIVTGGQAGVFDISLNTNPTHATQSLHAKFRLISYGGNSGNNTATPSFTGNLYTMYEKKTGWNAYPWSYTLTFYKPASFLSIGGNEDTSWPVLMKFSRSSSYAGYSPYFSVGVTGHGGRTSTGLTDSTLEYIGTSTPSYYDTNNYSELTRTAWAG
jgi:hypothetical protein